MSRGEPCPNAANHTPHPSGYVAHGEWAERMLKTHKQERCPGCGLWATRVPKADQEPTGGEG